MVLKSTRVPANAEEASDEEAAMDIPLPSPITASSSPPPTTGDGS